MRQPILFSTPIWMFPEQLPKGVYEWSLEYKRKELDSKIISNRGGYQSIQKPWEEFKYKDYLDEILTNRFPSYKKFFVTDWWLNINGKGDYNLPHTHAHSDLSCIWYITNNEGLLYFEDPLQHTRQVLYDRIFSDWGESSNKNIKCDAGTVLVFPSDLVHRVEEHTLDTPRISVSFNMSAKY